MDWTTTASSCSTGDVLSLAEMQAIMNRESAKGKVIDSGFEFAAMGIVCPHCRKSMRYNEPSATLLVCCHVFEQMKREFSGDDQLGRPVSPLASIRVAVVEPDLLREI